jgi:arylsulfatase A-like enzyme
MGAFENTLIFFASDNGASAEIMVRNGGHDPAAPPGSAATYLCLGPGFSSACNTPHRRHKTWVHEGGISTPLIAHWPAGISAKERTAHHARACHRHRAHRARTRRHREAEAVEGRADPRRTRQEPRAAFAKDETIARDSLWWLHEDNKAIRVGDWKLVAAKGDAWALYDLKTDRAEQNDLAAKMPEKAKELADLWQKQTDDFTTLVKKTLADQPKGKGKGKKAKK